MALTYGLLICALTLSMLVNLVLGLALHAQEEEDAQGKDAEQKDLIIEQLQSRVEFLTARRLQSELLEMKELAIIEIGKLSPQTIEELIDHQDGGQLNNGKVKK